MAWTTSSDSPYLRARSAPTIAWRALDLVGERLADVVQEGAPRRSSARSSPSSSASSPAAWPDSTRWRSTFWPYDVRYFSRPIVSTSSGCRSVMPISRQASSPAWRQRAPRPRRATARGPPRSGVGWMRPSATSDSMVSRATSRRTGSKQLSTTASGVSSMTTLTPVICSKARMLRPSRPMMRPFTSSLGSCTTETDASVVCSRGEPLDDGGEQPPARWSRPRRVRSSRSPAPAPPPGAGRRARPRRASSLARLVGGEPGDVARGSRRRSSSGVASARRRARRAGCLDVEPGLALGEPVLAALDVEPLLVRGRGAGPPRAGPRRGGTAGPRRGEDQEDDDRAASSSVRGPAAGDLRGVHGHATAPGRARRTGASSMRRRSSGRSVDERPPMLRG